MGVIRSLWNRFWGRDVPSSAREQIQDLEQRIMKLRYEAAQTTDENENHWLLADHYSPTQALTPFVRKRIRQRARYEARENNSYANGICTTLVDEYIGRGPLIQFPDLSLEDSLLITRSFAQWGKETAFQEKVRTLVLAEIIEGEGLGILFENVNNENPVNLDIQVIEPDYLEPPHGLSVDYPDGIRFDENGYPTEYHILQEHPGSGLTVTQDGTWYGAESILHQFRQERAGQVRGVSRLAPCLNLFALLRRFTLATVEAAETAASLAAIMYSDTDPMAAAPLGEDEWFDAIPLVHRSLLTIPRGWKVSQMTAEHPSSTYEAFKRELMNEISRCLNIPLNIALMNSSGYNYASGRLDHLTFYRSVANEQQRYERMIYDRIFKLWYQEAYLANVGLVPRKRLERLRWIWTWDRNKSADPYKEALADIELLKAGLLPFSDYYASKGQNWEEKLSQIAKERKFLLDNEINIDMITPAPEPEPAEAPPNQEDSSQNNAEDQE